MRGAWSAGPGLVRSLSSGPAAAVSRARAVPLQLFIRVSEPPRHAPHHTATNEADVGKWPQRHSRPLRAGERAKGLSPTLGEPAKVSFGSDVGIPPPGTAAPTPGPLGRRTGVEWEEPVLLERLVGAD